MIANVPVKSEIIWKISNIFGNKPWFLFYNISGKKLYLKQRSWQLGSVKFQSWVVIRVHKGKEIFLFEEFKIINVH